LTHLQQDGFPPMTKIIVAISQGIQRAVALLQGCGVKTDLTTRTGFFKQPCKHFPKTDSYVKAGGLLASAERRTTQMAHALMARRWI
jgi:hypothetical protein